MGMSLPVTSFYRELPYALYILILIKPYWPPPILWYFIPSFLYQHSSFSLHPRYPLVKERLYRDWSSYCQEGLADWPQVEFTSIHHNLNPGPQANWLMSSTFSQALFWVFYLISIFSPFSNLWDGSVIIPIFQIRNLQKRVYNCPSITYPGILIQKPVVCWSLFN